ncbi:group 1 truncated hemoglobin [Rhodocytophaga rosea]|uniref:Group 1 truncated hemoglobin n=1 Tax=Rhodocytophaga rosea TaxID=2704465 RepID=A0A6C0GRA2_9BACT|nr:group 1 truncated hemoglobin [Rhodocytophaga rosea]QHT70625.1 group 1 truncated hemoglobin [Rhodocytophaga rosea]
MNTMDDKSLFEKIGGMYAVDAAVEIFYNKVLADDRISHFFRWTHMKTQHAKQKAFLAYAFGAPLKYSGKSMSDAHKNLLEIGLNELHFDVVKEHLLSTLRDMEVAEELILRVSDIAESTRDYILGNHVY